MLCFLGCMNLYAQRVNMSVALVCMLNHTDLELKNHQKTDNVSKSDLLKNDSIILEDVCSAGDNELHDDATQSVEVD